MSLARSARSYAPPVAAPECVEGVRDHRVAKMTKSGVFLAKRGPLGAVLAVVPGIERIPGALLQKLPGAGGLPSQAGCWAVTWAGLLARSRLARAAGGRWAELLAGLRPCGCPARAGEWSWAERVNPIHFDF